MTATTYLLSARASARMHGCAVLNMQTLSLATQRKLSPQAGKIGELEAPHSACNKPGRTNIGVQEPWRGQWATWARASPMAPLKPHPASRRRTVASCTSRARRAAPAAVQVNIVLVCRFLIIKLSIPLTQMFRMLAADDVRFPNQFRQPANPRQPATCWQRRCSPHAVTAPSHSDRLPLRFDSSSYAL